MRGKHGDISKVTELGRTCFSFIYRQLFRKEGGDDKEGDVLIHAHVNASDEDQGVSCGGHLMEGSIIYPFAEVILQECEGTVGRIFDKKTDLWPMKFQ